MTNDATLIWQWTTNFWLDTETNGAGMVSLGDDWHQSGTNVELFAQAMQYWHFGSWTGDTNGCTATDTNLDVIITQPRSIIANFAENLAARGTPEWWLARHGWTSDFANAEALDIDGDGMFTWQEFVSDTNPTNSESVLAITSVESDPQGIRVRWQGGQWATQYIESCSNLIATPPVWTTIWTNIPKTSITNTIPVSNGSNGVMYYRIKTGVN